MNESRGARDVQKISKIAIIVGIVMIIAGVAFRVTAPAELPMGSDGWMDSVRANGDAEFRGTSLIMFGAFVLLAGAGLSARARRAGIALTKENMQAVGEGLSAGLGGDPAARLERLESLRRNGTVTDEEYRRKRAEIVAQL
jgi:hypothetical protein